MSYLIEGPLFFVVGLFLVLIVPIGGLTVIVLSIMIIVTAAREQKPGSKPGLCSFLGHDWRKDLPGHKNARVCRNCLKGAQLNYGAPVNYGVPTAAGYGGYSSYSGYPGYVPAAPAPGYVPPDPYPPRPGYVGAPAPRVAVPAPPPAPPPAKYATVALPARERYCQSCGLGVAAGTRICPHCGRPA